ncbi:MAG: RsmG family class I SAM-dependent methyltransferase [Thermoanaerobaculia bacterium]
MSSPGDPRLPELDASSFSERLRLPGGEPLHQDVAARLHAHYQELRRWNARLSLVGPGTAGEILERHYAESLAALALIPPARSLVDLGSGAGFPGFVLAAARPELEVTLVEGRERKWAFLEAVRRRASLSCQVLNARVSASLPPGWPRGADVVTSRALRLEPAWMAALGTAMSPEGRFLLWVGEELPALPEGWTVGREVRLEASRVRRVVEVRRVA